MEAFGWGNRKEYVSEQSFRPEVMEFFNASHLPPHLKQIADPICDLAEQMLDILGDRPCGELVKGFNKLLEAKDCFVRTQVLIENNRLPDGNIQNNVPASSEE